MNNEQTAQHYRTVFVVMTCFLLTHTLFGEDVLKHNTLIVSNSLTRLLILAFIYRMPN